MKMVRNGSENNQMRFVPDNLRFVSESIQTTFRNVHKMLRCFSSNVERVFRMCSENDQK